MNGYSADSQNDIVSGESQSLLQQCLNLEKLFYAELESAEARVNPCSEDIGLKALNSVMLKYSVLFDKIANSYLKEEPIKPLGSIVELPAVERPDGTIAIDDELLNYVLDNTDQLRRRQMDGRYIIEDFERDAYCLICDKRIKGLGLMDTVDAGVNAVCFNCIDKKHHYIGGGIYFTNFI